MILHEDAKVSRSEFAEALNTIGFETRPIVAGNFLRNSAINFFDNFEVFEYARNADILDDYGLFIGNHHYPMDAAFSDLKVLVADIGR